MSKSDLQSARSRARELIVQSLYQQQITGHDVTELLRQFRERPEYERVDQAYYDEAMKAICVAATDLEKEIGAHADRPVEQLDPVERSILLLGFFELKSKPDVPYKVVINEAVNLTKRLGALDGHKYINALLDSAAKTLRPET